MAEAASGDACLPPASTNGHRAQQCRHHRCLALRLCAINFLVNCKPSEPFLAQYLINVKNLTDTQLATQVWPWSTFGTFALLLPFGLLAEVLGCRAVVLVGLLCRELTRIMLIFGEGVRMMAAMQVVYAGGDAAQVIFIAYIFTVAPAADYARLTSLVIASYHAGNVVAALAAEALITAWPAWRHDQTPLFYLSWLTSSLGLLAFTLLPPPLRKPPPSLATHLCVSGPRSTLKMLLALWASFESRRWLVWYCLAASGHAVIGNYFQLQLSEVCAKDGTALATLLRAHWRYPSKRDLASAVYVSLRVPACACAPVCVCVCVCVCAGAPCALSIMGGVRLMANRSHTASLRPPLSSACC